MSAATPAPGTPPRRRRGPRPRHSREDVVRAAVAIADSGGLDGLDAVTFRAVAARLGTGVMSLYNYVPDKQTLIYEMVEAASADLDLPEPTGDWLADMHLLARRQRDLVHHHPWLADALSPLQPIGPGTLAWLEFALAALEPTGLSVWDRLETAALLNGFVANIVRSELTNAAASAPVQAGQFAQLPELLATGKYPRFAAVIASGGQPVTLDLAEHFDRLFDRILTGLVGAGQSAGHAHDRG